MKMLPIDRVVPGMTLGTDIELNGRTLLRAGVALSERHLRRLQDLGIRTLYVWDEPPGSLAWADVSLLTQSTRRSAHRVLRQQMRRLRENLVVQSRPVFRAVQAILEEVLARPDVVLQLSEVRAMGDYPFSHAVSVAATSVLLGLHSGLNLADLKALAVGALLHDVGKVRLPEQLWMKPGRLTDGEYRLMQQHTGFGYEILRAQGAFDLRSAHVAWEHHERWDGTGYPRGLAGEQIHTFARLVAVVDVFDALTTDRPYRPAWPRHRAIGFLADEAGKAFDPVVVRRFLARVAPYPVGFRVRLNTGELAQVVRIIPGLPARPVVQVLDGSRSLIDLSQDLARRIVGPAEGVAG